MDPPTYSRPSRLEPYQALPAHCAEVGVAKSSRAAQGYGLPLDAPKTGAKRLDLLAGPPEALQ
jgi:hypothetical protein